MTNPSTQDSTNHVTMTVTISGPAEQVAATMNQTGWAPGGAAAVAALPNPVARRTRLQVLEDATANVLAVASLLAHLAKDVWGIIGFAVITGMAVLAAFVNTLSRRRG